MAQNSLRIDDARVNTERRIPFEVSTDPFTVKRIWMNWCGELPIFAQEKVC